jgi:SAM-dependent methyltransferase
MKKNARKKTVFKSAKAAPPKVAKKNAAPPPAKKLSNPSPKAAATSNSDSHASAVPCNICGGTQFKAGPGGRLSATQKFPACLGCGALERHRVCRDIFDKIRSPIFKKYSCLSFGRDRSIAGGWFKSMTIAEADSANALDVEHLSLPDESVDVVVCNHVLGAVRDCDKAFKELVRVTSRQGFVFVSFGNPQFRQKTEDWGYADPNRHGLYRTFGSDIEGKLRMIVPGVGIARLVGQDPVTGAEDRAYVFTRNLDLLGALGENGLKIRFLHF